MDSAIVLMIMAVLTAIGTVSLAVTLTIYRIKLKSRHYTHAAAGVITDIKATRYTGKFLYKITVEYGDIRKYHAHMKHIGSECPYSVGDLPEVLYDEKKPHRSHISAWDEEYKCARNNVLASLFPYFMVILLGVLKFPVIVGASEKISNIWSIILDFSLMLLMSVAAVREKLRSESITKEKKRLKPVLIAAFLILYLTACIIMICIII